MNKGLQEAVESATGAYGVRKDGEHRQRKPTAKEKWQEENAESLKGHTKKDQAAMWKQQQKVIAEQADAWRKNLIRVGVDLNAAPPWGPLFAIFKGQVLTFIFKGRKRYNPSF